MPLDRETIARVIARWSDRDLSRFSPAVYWLANDAVFKRYQERATGGSGHDHWLDYCVERHLDHRPVKRMLSVGCGAGKIDRRLADLGAFKQLDGIDLSPTMIELARAEATKAEITTINYRIGNIETDPLEPEQFDAIVASSSIHHFLDLDLGLARLASALVPGGVMFVNEYIGPDRFAFSAREREAIEATFRLLPERFRVSLEEASLGEQISSAALPDPIEVERDDPSEASTSSWIPAALANHFEIVEQYPIGGTILQSLLHRIAGHFRPDDPDSMAVLDLTFRIEETLIAIGDIQPHFALFVVRRKS